MRLDELNRVLGLFSDAEQLNPQFPAHLDFPLPNVEPTQAKKHGKQLGGVAQLLTQFPGTGKGASRSYQATPLVPMIVLDTSDLEPGIWRHLNEIVAPFSHARSTLRLS